MTTAKVLLALVPALILAQQPPTKVNPYTGKSDFYGSAPWMSSPAGATCASGALATYSGILYICGPGNVFISGGGVAVAAPSRSSATVVTLPTHYVDVPNKSAVLVTGGDINLSGAGAGTVFACASYYGLVLYYSGTVTLGALTTGVTNGGSNNECPDGTKPQWHWTVTGGNWDVSGYTNDLTSANAPVLVKSGAGANVTTDPVDGSYQVALDTYTDTTIHEVFDFIGSGSYPLVKIDTTTTGTLALVTTSQFPDGTNHPGLLRSATNTVQGTTCAVFGNANTQSAFLNMATATAGWDFRVLLRTPTTMVTNGTVSFGINSGSAAPFGVNKRIVIERAHTDANWWFKVCDGAACATSLDSGVALVNDGWVRLRVRSIVNGSYLFSVNNGTEQTITTNDPGTFDAFVGTCLGNTGAAAAIAVDIDRMEIHLNPTR